MRVEERLQKILSAAGVCSRRRAEEYLAAGRVTVNGRPARLGDKADPGTDRVELDGRAVCAPAAHTYVMLHKPRGYVTTLSDEKGRPTVTQLLTGCGARVWPMGRLDMDSEGLLLLSDDGTLTQRLTHPSHGVEKEYRVKVRGDAARGAERLRTPILDEGELLSADRVEQTADHVLTVVIHQGKNRQVRRMCAAVGLEVLRLQRVREGFLRLGELPPGRWRPLTPEEVARLRGENLQE